VRRERKDSFDLLARKAVEHFDNVIDREAVFEIFEDCGHGPSGPAENPSTTRLACNTLDSGALGPIEGHVANSNAVLTLIRPPGISFGL
jgi:hypothetical protein